MHAVILVVYTKTNLANANAAEHTLQALLQPLLQLFLQLIVTVIQ